MSYYTLPEFYDTYDDCYQDVQQVILNKSNESKYIFHYCFVKGHNPFIVLAHAYYESRLETGYESDYPEHDGTKGQGIFSMYDSFWILYGLGKPCFKANKTLCDINDSRLQARNRKNIEHAMFSYIIFLDDLFFGKNSYIFERQYEKILLFYKYAIIYRKSSEHVRYINDIFFYADVINKVFLDNFSTLKEIKDHPYNKDFDEDDQKYHYSKYNRRIYRFIGY